MQNFIINAKADVSTIDIIGDIGESWFSEGITMQSVRNQLKEITSKEIVLNVSSLGGDLNDALVIHDIIRLHPAHVTSKIFGVTASSGTIVADAGDKKLMSTNALFLVHEASTMTGGNAREHRRKADALDKHDARIIDLYFKSNIKGKTKEEIQDLMIEEKFIDANEAVEFGFIHDTFEPMDAAASITEDRKKEILNKLKETKKEEMDFKNELVEIKRELSGLKDWITNGFKAKDKPEDFETQVNARLTAFEAKIAENETLSGQITDLSEKAATAQSEKDTVQGEFDALKIKSDKFESDYNALKAEKTVLDQIKDPDLNTEKEEITALGSEITDLLSDDQKATLKNIKKQ